MASDIHSVNTWPLSSAARPRGFAGTGWCSLVCGLRAASLLILALLICACEENSPTAYDSEVQSLHERLLALESGEGDFLRVAGGKENGDDPLVRDLRRVYLLYSIASLTTDYDDFMLAEHAIDEAILRYGELYDLLLFRASFNLKMHRLQLAETDLRELADVADDVQVRAMLADIALQKGEYEHALKSYQTLVTEQPDWDLLARLAWFYGKTGRGEEADALYLQAQEQLSYQELRQFAWLELQRGLLDLDRHEYEGALKHYERADLAYPGYWLIEEHIAEVLALLGEHGRARSLYADIIADTHNPELVAALAQLEEGRDPKRSRALVSQAEALFEQHEALYPEASRGHYISYLLQQDEVHPGLLRYAEQARDSRPYAESQLLLVQAYLKTGDHEAASAVFGQVRQSPWRSREIDHLANEIETGDSSRLNGR